MTGQMLRRAWATIGLCATAMATPQTVVAQAAYGGGGYGQTAYGGYGQQSGYGGGYGQQSGYGSGAFGGGQGGGFGGGYGGMANAGGFGAGGMSSFGAGGMGAQGGAFGQTSMMGGGMAGGGMFGGGFGQQQGGRAGQRNFVGRDATEVQAGFQNQFGAPQQGGQFFADVVQNFNDLREQRRRWRDRQNAPPPVRVQLRPAFDLPVRGMNAEVVSGLQTRVNQMLETRGVGSAQVESTEQGVVLTGSVASDHDRRLIAVLASLEPGVARVDNRLTVATPTEPAPVSASTAPENSQ